MSQKAKTKDETFLMALSKQGQDDETYDGIELGKKLGYQERGIKNIIRHLAQANLVKKYGDAEVAITDRGRALALELAADA